MATGERCSICGSEYGKIGHGRRTLPCAHFFCYPCLKTCVLEGTIYCNLCGEESTTEPLETNWQIFIKLEKTSQTIYVDISPHDSIEQLYELASEKSGVPTSQIRLIFGGKVLVSDSIASISAKEMTNNCTIHLLLALRGD